MNHVLTEQFNLLPIEQLWGNVNFCGTKMVVMKCFGKLHCSTLEVGQNNKKSHRNNQAHLQSALNKYFLCVLFVGDESVVLS